MHQYWSECANTLIKIENLLVKARDTTCASENFNVKMISYSKTFRIFGEMATLKDNGKKLKGKLKARDLTAFFWDMLITTPTMYSVLSFSRPRR